MVTITVIILPRAMSPLPDPYGLNMDDINKEGDSKVSVCLHGLSLSLSDLDLLKTQTKE